MRKGKRTTPSTVVQRASERMFRPRGGARDPFGGSATNGDQGQSANHAGKRSVARYAGHGGDGLVAWMNGDGGHLGGRRSKHFVGLGRPSIMAPRWFEAGASARRSVRPLAVPQRPGSLRPTIQRA